MGLVNYILHQLNDKAAMTNKCDSDFVVANISLFGPQLHIYIQTTIIPPIPVPVNN